MEVNRVLVKVEPDGSWIFRCKCGCEWVGDRPCPACQGRALITLEDLDVSDWNSDDVEVRL